VTIATTLLWVLPDLDERPRPSPAVPAEAPEAPADPRSAGEPGAAAATANPGLADEAIEREAAKGYAEGFARGLAEGREQGLDEGREQGFAEGREQGLAEGREQGYAAGWASGADTASADFASHARQLRAILIRLCEPVPALDAIVEEAVAALALEIARCVIGRETAHSREYLVALIREAVAKVPIEMGVPKLELNPDDLEAIRRLAPELVGAGAVLVGDDAIEPGDCRVICDNGGTAIKDRRWRPRLAEGASQVDLSLTARWRAAMLAMFEGEDR
jgi:flagellar assembly protein FliH